MSLFQLIVCLGASLVITCVAAEFRSFNSAHYLSDEIRVPKFYILTSPQTFPIGCATNVTVIVHTRFGETLVTMNLIEEGSKKVLAASEAFIRWYEKGKPKNIPIWVPLTSKVGYGVLKIKLEGTFSKEESIFVQIKKPALKTLIKTEKYGYYANEKVRAWIFAFDRKLLPYTGKVDLLSSEVEEGTVIFSQNNVELTTGSASIEFPLPPNAKVGKYVLKAKVEGQEAKVSFAVLWKPPDVNTNSTKGQDKPKDLTRQRVKKELRKMQRDVREFDDPRYDDTYSKTSSFVSIIKPDHRFKVHKREGIVVTYNNPSEGINHFYYQIKCKGDVILSRPYKDLHSSFLCLMGLPVVDRLDILGGPSRRYLCKRRSTKFRLIIQVTPEMVPFCSLVVYRIVNEAEIVADSVDLETEGDFLQKVLLQVNKFDVTAEEEMTLKLKGKPGSKVYLHGQKWIPVHRSRNEDVMEEREVLQFLRSPEHGREVASLIHQCKAINIKTSKQIFQDIGLMVRSSLETDPVVFCAAYNSRAVAKHNTIQKRNARKQNSQYLDSTSRPWVWKEYTLNSGELSQTLRAPSDSGIWYLQATSMSQEGGLGMSEFILVQVSEKIPERSNSAAFNQQDTGRQGHNITIEVKAFNFLPHPKRERCRPLYLEICLHSLKSHIMVDSSALILMDIKSIPGFAFVETQIEKMLMVPKKTNFAYQINEKTLMIQCKGCLGPCMDIALKQTESLQSDNRAGQVSIRISNGGSQSLLYTITDEVCFGF